MTDRSSPLHRHTSKLVLLRLWCEPNADGGEQLCGKIQLVVSGEAQCFAGGDALVELLSEVLRRSGAATDGADA